MGILEDIFNDNRESYGGEKISDDISRSIQNNNNNKFNVDKSHVNSYKILIEFINKEKNKSINKERTEKLKKYFERYYIDNGDDYERWL